MTIRTPEHYATKYADVLATVREYAPDAECVDLGAGYFAFWGALPSGYTVGISNDDMDGVGDGGVFTTSVYRFGEFIAHLIEGTLPEQLANASIREMS